MTGVFLVSDDRVIFLPSKLVSAKSGAVSPILGVLPAANAVITAKKRVASIRLPMPAASRLRFDVDCCVFIRFFLRACF